jgi:hypothetical protein
LRVAEVTTPDNKKRPRGPMGAEIYVKLDGPPPTDEKECRFDRGRFLLVVFFLLLFPDLTAIRVIQALSYRDPCILKPVHDKRCDQSTRDTCNQPF